MTVIELIFLLLLLIVRAGRGVVARGIVVASFNIICIRVEVFELHSSTKAENLGLVIVGF
jgi:hypothetical protein